MARHDAISEEGERKISQLLLAGLSIARVAKAVGTCCKTVSVRRAKMKKDGAKFPLCGCGRPACHIGMCKHRAKLRDNNPIKTMSATPVSRTTIHPEFEVHLRRARNIPPPNPTASVIEIVEYIEAIVPHTYPEHVRDDIKQEAHLHLLESGCTCRQLVEILPCFVQAAYSQTDYFGRSLDSLPEKMRDKLIFGDAVQAERSEYITNEHAAMENIRPGFIANKLDH